LVGQPVACLLETLLTSEHFEPRDAALAAVRLLDGRVEDAHARPPDVRPGAITFDERNDGLIGHHESAVLPLNRIAARCHAALDHLSKATSQAALRLLHRSCGKACGRAAAFRDSAARFRSILRFAPSWCAVTDHANGTL